VSVKEERENVSVEEKELISLKREGK